MILVQFDLYRTRTLIQFSSIAAANPWTAIKVFDETLPTVGLMGTNIHRLLIFEWVLLFRKLI